MFNVGGGEVFVILLVALLVLGPRQLPAAARQVGQFMTELRKMSSGFQNELQSALDAEDTSGAKGSAETTTPDDPPSTPGTTPSGEAQADT